MTRIDTATPTDERVRAPAEQPSVAAVEPLRTLEDGRNAGAGGSPGAQNRAPTLAPPDSGSAGGVHVDLSGAGKAMAIGGEQADRVARNADIDETDLPDQIKDLLKRIRQIREELRQKQAELREAMADTKLKPEQRKMKVAMLQAEVMALTGALMLASNALSKLIRELKLSSEQAMVAGQLIMA